jgi:hypothetical protein
VDTRVHLYDSHIDFFGEISGWRYYIYHYRSMIISISLLILFIFNLILVLCCFGTCLVVHEEKEEKEEIKIEMASPPSPKKVEPKIKMEVSKVENKTKEEVVLVEILKESSDEETSKHETNKFEKLIENSSKNEEKIEIVPKTTIKRKKSKKLNK